MLRRRPRYARSSSAADSVVRSRSTSALELLELRRMLAIDQLDPDFGNGGVVTDPQHGLIDAGAVAVDATTGNVAIVGDTAGNAVVAQYDSAGNFLWSFPLNAHFDDAIDVAVDSAGRVVVAGTNTLQDFVVARLTGGPSGGSLDVSFAGDGVFDDLVLGSHTATAVAVRPDNSVLVVGNDGNSGQIGVLQLDADGIRDEFIAGDNGYVVVNFQTSSSSAAGIALQNDGTAVIAGQTSNLTQDYALALLEPDGTLAQTVIVDDAASDLLTGVAVGPGDAIHAVGISNQATFLLTFDAAGTLTNSTAVGSDLVGGVDTDAAGNVYVAVSSISFDTFGLTRFTPAGALDTGFGTNGTVTAATGGAFVLTFDVAVNADEKPVAFGISDANIVLARWGDDGGGGGDQLTVAPDGNDLVITGTAGADSVIIRRVTGGVSVEGNGTLFGTFSPTGRIRVTFGDGADQLNVSGSLGVSLFVDGGAGNDTLKAGGVNDILLGGDGNDRLMGASGRDLLIGGDGADRILGQQADDILISGWTDYDDDLAALDAIMSEWMSGRDFNTRMANLNGTGTGPRNNGNTFLIAGVTVHDDADADSLNGNGGEDWFVLNNAMDRTATILASEFGEALP